MKLLCSRGVSSLPTSIFGLLLSYVKLSVLRFILFQFFPTAEESIDYYNQKRCFDGKALVLPSQIVSVFVLFLPSWRPYQALKVSFLMYILTLTEICQIF